MNTSQTIKALEEKIKLLAECIAPIYLKITSSQVLSGDISNMKMAMKLFSDFPELKEQYNYEYGIISINKNKNQD